MPYQVTLKTGLSQVTLPNGSRYQGGDTVVLSDDDFSTITAPTLVSLFSSVSAIGGGAVAGVTSVNGKDGDVVLAAADVGAATADHTHTLAALGAAAASHTHSAAQVTGTFAASQIPSLDTSKIGSGVLAGARLPKGAAVADVAQDAEVAAVSVGLNALLASLRAAGYLGT